MTIVKVSCMRADKNDPEQLYVDFLNWLQYGIRVLRVFHLLYGYD